MTTSGTSVFNLDLNNLVEESFERCGKELRTGYDLRTARRSLNLLTIEWANRGINLWTMDQGAIPLVTGQAIYPVPNDTIQLLDTVIRQNNATTNQSDINISNIAEPTYSSIPNKLTQGRPIQYWFNRQSGETNPTTVTLGTGITATDTTITVSNVSGLAAAGFIKIGSETISYPNVDVTNNQLLNCARGQNYTTAAAHLTGAAISVQNLPCVNLCLPRMRLGINTLLFTGVCAVCRTLVMVSILRTLFRLLPCLVAGLAFYLAIKLEGVPADRIQMLKMHYEEQWTLASS
jgi:hypothetical protein